ncbi:MAG: gluconokinase [bacterium]|nr:gluconokinase [bacterium]
MEDLILTIDAGTGSVRAIIFNLKGEVVARSYRKNNLYQEHFNWAVQKPEEIFENIIQVCNSVSKDIKSGKLIGWTISTYYHSLLLLDKDNRPITDILTWADLRANKEAEIIKERYGGFNIYKKTGCPVHPMYPLSKVLWFLENEPELRDFKVATAKDYLVYRLFGERIIDETTASTLGFLNIHSLKWDEDVIGIVGLKPKHLPEILPTTHIIDGKKLKVDIPQLKSIPFILGAGDGALSSLGMGAIEEKDVGIMVGTSGAVRTFSAKPILDERQRIWNYYFTKGLWLIGGAINNGGITLRWVRDTLYQDLVTEGERLGIDPYDLITKLAEKSPVGSKGLIILPFLTGERNPYWNDKAQGTIIGLGLSHTREDITRAFMESVCYRLYSVYSALRDLFSVENFNEIRAGGGFSRSKLWLQIMSDIFGKELIVPTLEENTSLGAMVLVGVALNIFDSLKKAKELVKIREGVKPDMKNHLLYERLYDLYMDAYWTLSSIFERLYDIKKDLT